MVALQTEMFNYHDHLVATHPYASSWWQWPILERPISYYYHDFRTGAGTSDPAACCVAEILALPNRMCIRDRPGIASLATARAYLADGDAAASAAGIDASGRVRAFFARAIRPAA